MGFQEMISRRAGATDRRAWIEYLVVTKFLCLAAFALLLASKPLSGCTVFFAFDGKLAIAGDNEDFDHPYTQMWTVPGTRNSYGVIYFGFGRGEYPAGGATLTARARRVIAGALPFSDLTIEDSYGSPQQGMNEKGLFFGGAATEMAHADASRARKTYDGVLVDFVLRHAANVKEALHLIESYDFPSPEGQLLFADHSGNSFIFEAGNVVLPGTGRYQIITNFLQSREPGEKSRDRRYKIVDRQLSQGPELSHDLVRALLQEAQQDITQYSTVFDLTNIEVQIYHRRQFGQVVTIHIPDELAKGPRATEIRRLFERAH
jgi:hypothetical protein